MIMRNFKFLSKTFDGKPARPIDIKHFGLSTNDINIIANNFNELRKTPPNIVITECMKDRKFSQDKDRIQILKKGNKYGMGLGVFQQLWFDPSTNERILKPADIKFYKLYKPYTGQSLDNKTLLVIRTGGIGDLLFIQPNLIYLKEKYPTCKIIFGCGPQYHSMVDNWSCIDELCDLPIPLSKIIRSNYHAVFEGVVERCTLAKTINVYRLFSDWMGVCLPDEKLIPKQTPKQDKLELAKSVLSEWNIEPNSFILILLRASSPIRTPRPEFWRLLINEITKRGHKVIITDAPYMKDHTSDFISICDNKDMIYNFSTHSTSLDCSIALASLAKCCISTDTSLIHIAASLDIPAVGIYGPFPGNIRLSTYPKVKWVDAQYPCAPCYIHGPTPCKNSTDGHSQCYDFINILEVADNVEELIK